jgi:hypothetical protein
LAGDDGAGAEGHAADDEQDEAMHRQGSLEAGADRPAGGPSVSEGAEVKPRAA